MTDLNKERMELELSAGVLDRQIDNLKAEIADEYFDDEKLELLIEYAMKLGEVYAQRDLLEKAKAQAVPEGYVVVPKDVAERTIGHIGIAICHPNNTRDEENIMSEDQVVIERAIDASESGAEG
ncbi:hypothetical protein [Acinetobacter baumannii]|uniref:hypothetical protein n=1 Tax=Acinetobacter baumannii TaxID=470 RepID=UPI001D17FDCA|nr:hypothetical protein [Acinetobacter baumannii]